jgi:hypothetical protein
LRSATVDTAACHGLHPGAIGSLARSKNGRPGLSPQRRPDAVRMRDPPIAGPRKRAYPRAALRGREVACDTEGRMVRIRLRLHAGLAALANRGSG